MTAVIHIYNNTYGLQALETQGLLTDCRVDFHLPADKGHPASLGILCIHHDESPIIIREIKWEYVSQTLRFYQCGYYNCNQQ